MIMSTIIRSALVAVAVLGGASSAIAQSTTRYDDASRYSNSPDSVRAFWDAKQRDSQ
jgi:hypothetical protein